MLKVLLCSFKRGRQGDTSDTFRATGIITYLENAALEHAQIIANHESLRTTKLYDRTREELSLDELERINI